MDTEFEKFKQQRNAIYDIFFATVLTDIIFLSDHNLLNWHSGRFLRNLDLGNK